ncbi:MAG: hypothetical protein VX438_12165 [Planctomycetota bacterium]|nr:hypothetical protein [Planctomycetota bacterium]
MANKYTIILPYYCQDEIDRYMRIGDHLMELGVQKNEFEFLLAASPKIRPSREFEKRFSRIAPTISFSCPTKVFGYPEGPTAMFWDCMEFLSVNSNDDDQGFGLWLESDMIPIKPNWLDLIVEDWHSGEVTPLLMGCLIPDVYKHRILKRPRKWIAEHVNGGACYGRHFAKEIPKEARNDVFDVAVYPYVLEKPGALKVSQTISLSTMQRCRSDIIDPRRMILHGFMQDKDDFIDKCRQPVSEDEKTDFAEPRHYHRFEQAFERTKLLFMGRGPEAMLHAMFLEMDRNDYLGRKVA